MLAESVTSSLQYPYMLVDVRRLGRLASPSDPAISLDANAVLKHVRIISPSASRQGDEKERFDELVACLLSSAVQRHKERSTQPANVENGWKEAVPVSIRDNLELSVEYLCMLVAIDFRHWDEQDHGALAAVGDQVRQKNFWAAVSDCSAPHAETDKPSLVRGSAAMVYLLREAVDRHHVHWYDANVLKELTNLETKAVPPSLLKVFEGVEEDGVSPMMMPAVSERITILVEIAKEKLSRSSSSALGFQTFLELISSRGSRLFVMPDGRPGFLDDLIALHPRYNDANVLTCDLGTASVDIPIYFLKLAQLTAIALEAAFPESIVFVDSVSLCVCSDYQLPKALRVSGLIVYDELLMDKVDRKCLLGVGSVEEVEIRVASTIAAAQLMEWANNELIPRLEQQESASQEMGGVRVDIGSLDYALWFYGRSFKEQAHHLCRTVMY